MIDPRSPPCRFPAGHLETVDTPVKIAAQRLAHGVTVAQAPLERFVKVRILVGQLAERIASNRFNFLEE